MRTKEKTLIPRRLKILPKMNETIEEMYAIQHNGTEDAYTAIEEDMQIICKKNC